MVFHLNLYVICNLCNCNRDLSCNSPQILIYFWDFLLISANNRIFAVVDKLSAEQRHKNMAAIHSKDTKPEMIVRKGLWSRGFRYRLNSPRLPGHPDLVLKKYRTCIFVNGCFCMDTKGVAAYLKRIGISGWRRYRGTKSGI